MEFILEDVLPYEEEVKTSNLAIRFDGIDDDQTPIKEDVREIGTIKALALQKEDLYQIHFDSIISWFLRCSFRNKLKCLFRMLQKLKDESYLDIIVSSLNFRMDKIRIYSQSLPNTNYIYDIKLNDHSRALERGFLEETVNMYITWFENLPPHEQIEIVVELLRRAGAPLVDKFYDLALKLKEDRSVCKPFEEDIQDIITDNSHVYNRVDPQQDIYKNPMVADVEKRTKTFYDALTKYTNQIMGISEKTKTPRNPKAGKSSGKNEAEKSSKSSAKKNSKSSKKNEKNSKKSNKSSKISLVSMKSRDKKVISEANIIDQIQELPIWIVKKIFNYCDQKTLKKLRTVNGYWAYVIDDMDKERNCRKYMDKVIRKMQKNMKYKQSDSSSKPKRNAQKLSIPQRRMKELTERGAIHPKLRTTNYSKTTYATLLEKATNEAVSNLVMATKGYESFPRNVPNNQILLATPTCVLNELGIRPYPAQSTHTKVGISDSELTDEGQRYARKKMSGLM